MLVGAAAEIWDVSVDVCSTRDGYVYAAGERLGYGELAATAARQWVPIRPRLKHPDAFSLIGQQKSLSGSPLGSPATVKTMLDFSARHNIAPVTEVFPMSRVNDALDHLRAGKARYRIVLTR